MKLSKERRIFAYATGLTALFSGLFIVLISQPSPLPLSVINQDQPIAESTDITKGDLITIFTIITGSTSLAYVIALSAIKR